VTTARPVVALVLADSPWPPRSGGDLRNVAIADALASVGQLVPILFPLRARPPAEGPPPGTIVHPTLLPERGRSAIRLRGLRHGRHPFLQHLVERGAVDAAASDLRRLGPDLIALGYPMFGPFLTAAGRVPIIVDLDTPHRLIDRRRIRAARRPGEFARAVLDLVVADGMEGDLDQHAAQVWFAAEYGRRAFERRQRGPARTHVVPNAVEVERFAPQQARDLGNAGVCFVGSLDYPPNDAAARRILRRILPVLRRRRPRTRFMIVGRRPSADLTRLVGATEGAELLADHPDPWSAAKAVGPLIVAVDAGGGTRIKILEAAAAGVPIISTSLGVEGLDLIDGRDLIVADTDGAIVAAALRLLGDPSTARRLTDAALESVRARYDIAVVGDTIRQAVREILPR
jgi:glycosyltransferase involved in cell wall biosynthesis